MRKDFIKLLDSDLKHIADGALNMIHQGSMEYLAVLNDVREEQARRENK